MSGFFIFQGRDKKSKFIRIEGDVVKTLPIEKTGIDIAEVTLPQVNHILEKLIKCRRLSENTSGTKFKERLMKPVKDLISYFLEELSTKNVVEELEKSSNSSLGAWIDSEAESELKTYFEFKLNHDQARDQSKLTKFLERVHLIGYRSFHKDIEVFMIYFSSSFYVVLKEGKPGRERKINFKGFPDISTRGAGVQIKQYCQNQRKRRGPNLLEYDNPYSLLSLTLWNTNISFLKVLNSNKLHLSSSLNNAECKKKDYTEQNGEKFVSQTVTINETELVTEAASSFKGSYTQTYVLMVDEKKNSSSVLDDPEQYKALFRYGNWCYEGEISLDENLLQLKNIPILLRKFQEQQSNLYFTYEYQGLPLAHQFQVPLSSLTLLSSIIKKYILSSERLLERIEMLHLQRNLNPWIDIESGKQYFELEVTNAYLKEYFAEISFLATKIYYKEIVFIVLYCGGRRGSESNSFYVTMNETRGDQPLLDLSFPDVSLKNKGYQLFTFNHQYFKKFIIWECQVSVWQTSNRMVMQQRHGSVVSNSVESESSEQEKIDEDDVLGEEKYSSTSSTSQEIQPKLNLKNLEQKEAKQISDGEGSGDERKINEKVSCVKQKSQRKVHHLKSIGSIRKQQSRSSLKSLPWDEHGRPKALKEK